MSNNGIDWAGLFNWSAKYNDGTKKTNFSPMTKEEREWLEKAMKEYTYNEADRMQEIIKVLFDQDSKEEQELLENLDELYEIIDIHPRNSTNLDQAGGFKLLMDTMLNNTHEKVRKLSMEIFAAIVQNNSEMQAIAYKYGGLNLMYKYVDEQSDKNKEQVLGALSSLLRTSVAEIKAEFFKEMKGLDWIKQIILEPETTKRALKKIFFLLYDLIVKETDKSVEKVLPDDHPIKDYIVSNFDMIVRMLNLLNYENEEDLFSDHVLREFILNCVGGVFQYNPELVSKDIEEYLSTLLSTISAKITQIRDNDGDMDTVHLLETENSMVEKIIENQGDFLLIH
ncbi:unnamed protein product [Moneuplotes crassus]|uniref:Nucleotide exchange factor Fes1 domain-containing protein n=2 Tax=Euplotes crassus TaxID=5936 RepID=A0AAD1XEG3_EUPCR|nr:unnamed protein product [Moneuplotes crassus]